MLQGNFKLKIILLGCLLFISLPSVIEAAELNFDVQAVIPKNQYDRNHTYFDLLVKPGQSQRLNFIVENTSKQSITIEVLLNSGWTNHNGVVSYAENTNKPDESMIYPITSLISEGYKKINLKAEEKKYITFQLNCPKNKFDGVIVGGFTFKEVRAIEENNIAGGESFLKNEIQIMKGISLRQNDNEIREQLVINKAKAQIIDYHQAFTINIQNPKPDFVREIDSKVEVFKGNHKEAIVSEKKTILAIAPNSNVDLPIFYEKLLEPGKYKLKIMLESKNFSMNRVIDFDVTQSEVKIIRETLGQPIYITTKLIMVKSILLFITAILLITFLIYYIKFHKKNK